MYRQVNKPFGNLLMIRIIKSSPIPQKERGKRENREIEKKRNKLNKKRLFEYRNI
jgi:hypothetical protein